MEKEYLENRLDVQIKWYDKKSKSNKKTHYILSILIYIISASIPIIALITFDYKEFSIALAGTFITLLNTIKSLVKSEKKWTEYRTVCETLQRHKYFYLAKCTPYDEEDSFKVLVSMVENIVFEENLYWKEYIKLEDRTIDN